MLSRPPDGSERRPASTRDLRASMVVRQLWRNASTRLSARSWKDIGKAVALRALQAVNLACALHLFAEYIGGPKFVSGPSMLPTMAASGELVIENTLSHRLHPGRLARGDLVTLASPLDPARIICKRVLGLPGDVVCVDPTGVKAPSTEHVVIPVGHIWIIGDNAAWSRDSRDYGPVSVVLVRGTLVARIWPWRDRTVFRNNASYID